MANWSLFGFLLDDASEYVRIQAVGALALFQAEEALPKFRDLLLNDKSEDVRVEVALALEFEVYSRNFTYHHDTRFLPNLIVCWEDDWGKECPVDVLELKYFWKKAH